QKVMERILKHCKKKITTVNNGLEAVELIKSSADHGIDLIFMDINMPIMDGLKATEEIRKVEFERGIGRERTLSSSSANSSAALASIEEVVGESSNHGYTTGKARLTIIGISGNAREQSVQNALGKGMDGYITKPWKKEDIYKAIGRNSDPLTPKASDFRDLHATYLPTERFQPIIRAESRCASMQLTYRDESAAFAGKSAYLDLDVLRYTPYLATTMFQRPAQKHYERKLGHKNDHHSGSSGWAPSNPANGNPRHFVEFYSDADVLCELVSDFVGKALKSNQGVFMISSLQRIHKVQMLLERTHHINVKAFVASGALFAVDCYSFLSDLTEGNIIQPLVYQERFGNTLQTLLAKFPKVAIYGDLVDGMVGEDHCEGSDHVLGNLAVQLEEWHQERLKSIPNL
ncbi:hypothetical protein HDV05_000850, partial [Chytridiales sp. JEL 0842]